MSERKKVNSIIRAVDILKVISKGNNKLSAISEELQLGKGTVHRILNTLEHTDMVKQDPINREYFLGPELLSLSASQSIAHSFLCACSRDELIRLRDLSRETVNLQIRLGLTRVCIMEYESLEEIKFISGAGVSLPIHLGSAGKMLMSEMNNLNLKILFEHISFDKICSNTIIDKRMMLEEIAKIRKQGYAVSFSERLKGSASISVPIKNYPTPVVLSVLGLENRFNKNSMKRCLKEMFKSASRISKHLAKI